MQSSARVVVIGARAGSDRQLAYLTRITGLDRARAVTCPGDLIDVAAHV